MRFTLSCLLTFLCIQAIEAQCDSSFFRYTGTFIKDMSLIDTSRIIGVGDNGYIIKSYDGGKSWKNIPTFTPYVLQAIQFTSDSVAYTVGHNRTILKTEDQGESWFSLYVNVSAGSSYDYGSLNDLYFFNNERGYIIGDNGSNISTNDGGRTWKSMELYSANRLHSINFITDSIGFTCGSSSSLYKTINGGRTWDKISIPAINDYETLIKVKFINSTTGFLLGYYGLCLKTVDAGITWTKINMPSYGTYHDIYFLNDTKGFIVGTGSGGIIFQTVDGGNTWNTVPNYPGQYSSYYCINADNDKRKIVIAGGGNSSDFYGHNGRNILSTTDEGVSFTPISRNGRINYTDMYFFNDSVGYIAGEEGTFQKTTNYGETWQSLTNLPYTSNLNNNNGTVSKIFFFDELNGYAATDNIYRTSDGGQTWNVRTTPANQLQNYLSVRLQFWDTLKGLVMYIGGIEKTTDGGITWKKVVTTNPTYKDLAVTPDGKAFAVGYNGHFVISKDEGTTWARYNLKTTKFLSSVYFYNNNIGYIGTNDSTIFKTIDGGKTWAKINTGIMYLPVTSFKFVNESTGYLVGNNDGGTSSIYKTKDGGLTWFFIKQETEDISRITGSNILYSAGGNGMILKLDKLQKPGIPGYISGPDKTCLNFKSYYGTGRMAGVDYNWVLESGGSHVYKNNLDTALFNIPGLHKISVSVSNACGVSPVRQFTTEAISFQPTITLKDTMLIATEGLTYQWIDNYNYISESQGGKSRTLIPKASGFYTVQVKSFYGCTKTSPAINYTLTRLICPGDNTLLTAQAGASFYNWQRDSGTGFVNIVPDNNYEGLNTDTLLMKNIPSAWYGNRFRCLTNVGPTEIITLRFVNTWTGNGNTNWENTTNWSCGNLPDENSDVMIYSGNVVINSNVTIRKLTINPQATITVQPGYTLTITH